MKLSVFAVALCALSVQAAESPITLSSLLDEMTDREAVTRFPEPCYRMRLWSSHSRLSVAPDKPGWFANWDWNNFVREETNAVGEVERVMVDAEGPGALVRAWVTGNAAGISTLRVYVDGAAKPLFEGVVTNLVGGTAICGAPLSQGLSPATPLEKQGFNLFLPIPYARHLKVSVVMPKPKETFYYNFETRTWPAGTAVESASKEVMSAAAKKVAAVNAILAQADEPVPAGETKTFDVKLQPGERKTLSFAGPGAIRYLQMKTVCPRDESVFMWGDEEGNVRDVEIRLAFDGVTTVKMPVGEFFNTGIWGCDLQRTRFSSVTDKWVMSSRWVMPFAKSCELTLVNTGDRAMVLKETKVVKGGYAWDARSMHFGATYVSRPDVPTRRQGLPYDVVFEDLKGRGLVVGTSVTVNNPARGWWGEGDEKVWVDGEKDPSYIGTGTEDFFCYAWCQHAPFSHPFVTQPCGDGNGDGAAYGGYAVNFRARALDAIPFRRSIRFDMELWHWWDVRIRYDTVSWHYLMP